jgi:CRISPR/Cas system endoribonuclease Cas6 (RAMP superfamily)
MRPTAAGPRRGRQRRAEVVATRSADLRWVDWERYSARQDDRMKLGGFVGTATFAGDLDVFMPFLRLGEVVHVGKCTAFGLGKYRLTSEER